ncbi:MAG: hypothetical protein Fur0046_20520 [Cyanobacteria bacterium J069]|nr:MAG: hypothetical protein D6742_01765 [Cyanobacteria bacterium J069]
MSEKPAIYLGSSPDPVPPLATAAPLEGGSSGDPLPPWRWAGSLRSILQQPTMKHGLLSASLLLLAIAAGNYLNFQGERLAQRWTNGLRYTDGAGQVAANDQANLRLYLDGFANSTPAERDRIQTQLGQIERRAKVYARISIFYYTRLFSAIALASSTGIIAAVCLFYISKVGWKDANNYIVNIFVVTSGITVLVGAFPVVFQQENNVQKTPSFS